MKKDEDGDLLYEGRLKKEKGVKVTLLLPDKYEDPPETYTTVEIFIITERSNIFSYFRKKHFHKTQSVGFTGGVPQHACAYL